MKNRIREMRKRKGLTLLELANKLNVSESTVQRYESGNIVNLKYETIEALSNILDCDPTTLMGWTDPSKEEITATIVGRMKSIKVSRVPILSEIPCGEPAMVYNSIDHDDFVEIDSTLAETGEYYGLRARGNSMSPKIEDGDTMIVHFQRDVESGQIAIVKVNGNEAVCKRIKKYRDGIELIPTNPSYAPKFYSNEEIDQLPIEIIGRVVEVRSKL